MKEKESKIGKMMVITGEIVTSADLVVEGQFHGSFTGKVLKVSSAGSVLGEVRGTLVDCAGRLEGKVVTDALRLRAGGCQVGTVVTGELEVEPGAILDCALQSGGDMRKSDVSTASQQLQPAIDLGNYLDAFTEENRPCCFEVPWSERFDLYKHIRGLLAKEKPLIKIMGEDGCGKSVLAAKLCAEAVKNQLVVELENKVGSVTELLSEVASVLGVDQDIDGQTEVISGIRAELKKRSAMGQNVVLVIDDAQEMFQATMEGVIRLLCGACGEEELSFDEIMQVILLGTREMKQNMVATILEYFEDETNCQLTLEPLNMKDTADYLRLGLQMVSPDNDKAAMQILPNETIKEIHVRSKGAVAVINLFVLRGLAEASARGERSLSPAVIKEMIIS